MGFFFFFSEINSFSIYKFLGNCFVFYFWRKLLYYSNAYAYLEQCQEYFMSVLIVVYRNIYLISINFIDIECCVNGNGGRAYITFLFSWWWIEVMHFCKVLSQITNCMMKFFAYRTIELIQFYIIWHIIMPIYVCRILFQMFLINLTNNTIELLKYCFEKEYFTIYVS